MLNSDYNAVDVNKIKLIIWDLDDTFWNGTLSEGQVELVRANVEILKISTDCGIINTICSKNDFENVEKKLKKEDFFDYFIYPSVNWEPKGNRVKSLIEALQLRDNNVLFVDDNESNLQEVKYYNPNIMTLNAKYLEDLYRDIISLERKDTVHKRLKQYKVLESKLNKKNEFNSNRDFLISCNIKVFIQKDCEKEFDRIHELILRTNQLNYTKKRIDREALQTLITCPECDCGYITALDNFGDYGIIGFYCLKDNALEHFLFSCRTMGMGIEQYIYATLGFPAINVVGSVSVQLNNTECPDYINSTCAVAEKAERSQIDGNIKILLKGPCDANAIFSFIEDSDNITCELTYVNPETGVQIEQHNHTQCILQSLSLSKERKAEMIAELPFGDTNMFEQSMFKQKYDIVFYSLLTDCGLGVYKRRKTGEYVSFSQHKNPLCYKQHWIDYFSGVVPPAHYPRIEEKLKAFEERYEFVGRISPEQILNNVIQIRENLDSSTELVLLLGSETPYNKNENPNYEDRHIFHKQVNDLVRAYAKTDSKIRVIEYTDCIKSQADFYGNINHYMRPVYYRIAEKMLSIISETMGITIKRKNKLVLLYETVKQHAKRLIKRHI